MGGIPFTQVVSHPGHNGGMGTISLQQLLLLLLLLLLLPLLLLLYSTATIQKHIEY